MLALVLAAAISSAAAPAAPAPASPTPVQGVMVKSKPADPDAVICRQEAIEGSRFTTRVCLTRAQREAREQATARYFRDRDDRAGMAPTMPSGNTMGGMGGH